MYVTIGCTFLEQIFKPHTLHWNALTNYQTCATYFLEIRRYYTLFLHDWLEIEWYHFCVFDFSRNAKDFDPFFAKFRENCERNMYSNCLLNFFFFCGRGHKKLQFSKRLMKPYNIFMWNWLKLSIFLLKVIQVPPHHMEILHNYELFSRNIFQVRKKSCFFTLYVQCGSKVRT